MTDNEKHLFLLDEIRQQKVKIDHETSILSALEMLAKKYSDNTVDTVMNEIEEMPDEFKDDLTIPKKVYCALNRIKSGTAHDVADSLLFLQPSFGLEKAFKDARTHLSRHFRNGTIKAQQGKKGRGYIYSIKEKP